jgi:manganese-dependent ADP-ribose/CDP-alcohol diphosphatase
MCRQDTTPSTNPKFTIGLLADIQYAPIPDGFSYGGKPRYYRHALQVAKVAAQHFQDERVPLVVNLGDIVDGKCQEIQSDSGVTVDPGHAAVSHVMDALSAYQHGPILHAYGNHCLYNLDRPSLQTKLGIPFVQEPCGDWVGYFSHCFQRYRFIVIDSYDIAKHRRCKTTSQKYQQAVNILSENNPNYPHAENSPEGLEDLDMRFVAFNGAVGPLQLEWLKQQLQECRENEETAVILSHQPILPGSSSPVCLIWNYDQVLSILRANADVVAASFCGHAHKGSYKRDDVSGIHFRVFEAALENLDKTYAMVDFYSDRIHVRGYGSCESAVYDMGHLQRKISLIEREQVERTEKTIRT